MSPRSVDRLLDDLEGLCQEAAEILKGVDLPEFLSSKTTQRAVERVIELIGDVATRLGDDAPDIGVPWANVRRMRSLLAHAYHRIDPQVVFQTASVNVPEIYDGLRAHRGRKVGR